MNWYLVAIICLLVIAISCIGFVAGAGDKPLLAAAKIDRKRIARIKFIGGVALAVIIALLFFLGV